jgi:hypothetical protein
VLRQALFEPSSNLAGQAPDHCADLHSPHYPAVFKILLCLIQDSSKLYSLMPSSTPNRSPETIVPLEQLRDLYERIPFVHGPARVALLHRLRGVTTELRKARASGLKATMAVANAVGAARGLGADTAS